MAQVITMNAPRRGRLPTQDGRQVFTLFPQYRRDGAHHLSFLYAVGFADGRTKIGVSLHPRSRVLQHWIAVEGLAWAHLFGAYPGRVAFAIEHQALKRAAEVARRIRTTEVFHGLSKQQAISCVRAAIAEWR